MADSPKKNAWFKHYNNATQGHTLSVLWSNGDTEAIAMFWLILELVSRYESDVSRGEMTVSWNTIGRETNWKPSKCRRVLARISPVSKIEITEKPGGYVTFLVPNWSILQENRGAKKSLKKTENSDRGERIEERGKSIDIKKGNSREKVSDFFEILNEQNVEHTMLTNDAHAQKVENFLLSESVFGNDIPNLFRGKLKRKFVATVVSVYEDAENFRSDLNSIINESLLDEKIGSAKSNYIATRIKKKTLELYNAAG